MVERGKLRDEYWLVQKSIRDRGEGTNCDRKWGPGLFPSRGKKPKFKKNPPPAVRENPKGKGFAGKEGNKRNSQSEAVCKRRGKRG